MDVAHIRGVLTSRWRFVEAGPFFEVAEPPVEFIQALPEDYLSVIEEFGGREGFIGVNYLRLYRLQELVALNLAYEVPSLSPEIVIFGSNGCGEAFAFLLGVPEVVQVPFLPLSAGLALRRESSFEGFIQTLAESDESSALNPNTVGREVHDKHPICLGGSPTDPANKVLVPAAKHAELCRFWNKVYRDALARQ